VHVPFWARVRQYQARAVGMAYTPSVIVTRLLTGSLMDLGETARRTTPITGDFPIDRGSLHRRQLPFVSPR